MRCSQQKKKKKSNSHKQPVKIPIIDCSITFILFTSIYEERQCFIIFRLLKNIYCCISLFLFLFRKFRFN